MSVKAVLENVNFAISLFGIPDDIRRHKEGLKLDHELHAKEMKTEKLEHLRELFTEKQIYLLKTYADIEAYCQELNENLIQSNRDAERDMMDQRNQQLQTILIAATIMLGAIVGVLFQADFPKENKHTLFINAYGVILSISISVLVASVFFCIILIYKINTFMINRSKANMTHLQTTLSDTAAIDDRLLSGVVEIDSKVGRRITTRQEQRQHNHHNHHAQAQVLKDPNKEFKQRKLTKLSAREIQKEFSSHEKEVEKYFRERDRLNRKLYKMVDRKRSFEKYWSEHCERDSQFAIYTFYIGTILNVIATAIFMFAYMKSRYKHVYCGLEIFVIMGISIVIVVVLALSMKFNKGIRNLEKEVKANANLTFEEQRKKYLEGEPNSPGEDEDDEDDFDAFNAFAPRDSDDEEQIEAEVDEEQKEEGEEAANSDLDEDEIIVDMENGLPRVTRGRYARR
jgi:uncharacterized membrane protein YidH (DUF202 family)